MKSLKKEKKIKVKIKIISRRRHREKRKKVQNKPAVLILDIIRKEPVIKTNLIFKNSLVKIAALILIIGLNWTGLSAVYQTLAYLNDTENSAENSFTAGALDFVLTSPSDFLPVALAPGESATSTIDIINYNNIHKYIITASNFVGELCDYLNLEANLDGEGAAEYTGPLTGFTFGPIVFEDPESWIYTLTLPADAPESVQGETCQFTSVVFGSQTKNDLPFGQGFNDIEDISSNIAAEYCYDSQTRSKGYWKNHENVYLPLLPQLLGATGTDEIIDTQQKVNQIFDDYSLSMRNKLKGQLLAMKFNVAYFAVGDYFVESAGKTINEIIAEADDLLRQDPAPSNSVLETMKNLLESLVDLQIQVCSLTPPPVIEPEIEQILSNIVINEFLPNPAGNDNASMPDGEWIELYNNTGADIDVAGWWFYDEQNSHELAITSANTDTGNTLIPNGGFLVVYRNGDADFALDNTGGDMVRLFNGAIGIGTLVDYYIYPVNAPEGKSFARIPDGSNNWVDPIPTPGEPNNLEGEDIIFGPAISEPDEEIEDADAAELTEEVVNNQREEGIIEQINEAIDSIIDEIVEEILPDELTNGETPTEDAQVINETAIIEEMPTVEEPVIEEVPAIEEQPVIVPVPEPEPEPTPEPVNEGVGL